MSNKVSRLTSILIGIVLVILAFSGWFFIHNQEQGGFCEGTVDDGAVKCSNKIDLNTNGLVYIEEPRIPLSCSVGNLYTAQLAGDTLNQINEIRRQNGLQSLTWDENLMLAAHIRAEECSQVWSHRRPNGLAFNTVDAKHVFGENLAFGYASAADAINGWMASESHRANILDKDFTKAAIAIYCASDGTYYWAQEFGW